MRRITLLLALMTFSQELLAQLKAQTAWLTISSNVKLNNRWGLHLDLQARSSDEYENISNLLFRPGIIYQLNSKSSFTLGYLHTDIYHRLDGLPDRRSEHQIFEQFLFRQRFKSVALNHRFRLGQKFFRQGAENRFAQGVQYLLKAIIPTGQPLSNFQEGMYLCVQDEVFLNVQNKQFLNGSHFGQNRAFAALGYRVSPKLDIEAGYLNHAIKGRNTNTLENAVQVMVFFRF